MKLPAAPFRPSPAEILASAPIPPSLRIVRGRRRAGRADPDPGRVQLRLAVQLQFELGDGRGRAQGRHLHDPGQLRLRRRRPGAELHAAAVAAAHRHPRRPGRVRQGGRRAGCEDRARPRHLHPHAGPDPAVRLRGALGALAHVDVLEAAHQAVGEHRVEQLPVAHAVPGTTSFRRYGTASSTHAARTTTSASPAWIMRSAR